MYTKVAEEMTSRIKRVYDAFPRSVFLAAHSFRGSWGLSAHLTKFCDQGELVRTYTYRRKVRPMWITELFVGCTVKPCPSHGM